MRHWQLRRCCVPLPFCGHDAARGFGDVTMLTMQLFVVLSLFNLNAGPLVSGSHQFKALMGTE